jgi:mono/diheme cytochrome c family protein
MKRVLSLLLLAAVAADARAFMQGSTAHADPNWQPPPKAEHLHNPLAKNSSAAVAGGKLFLQNCAQCHGPSGKGIDNSPDLTRFEVQVQTDGALFWKITNGNLDRGMPSFSGLPRLERWQIVSYLRKLAK